MSDSTYDDKDINKLLPLKDALKLNFTEYYKYAKGVYDHRENCGLQVYEKFEEWCKHLNCTQLESYEVQCTLPTPFPKLASTGVNIESWSTIPPHSTLPPPPNNLTYHPLPLTSIGFNGSCYDAFWCESRNWMGVEHLLAILALICCAFAFLGHAFFSIPALNLHANQSGCTLLLTAMCVCDWLYMVLFSWLFIWPHLSSADYEATLARYAQHVAPTAPHLLPLMQLMELLPLWILVILLVDRFLYLKYGLYSKRSFSRCTSLKIIGSFLVVLAIYTGPKFFMYKATQVQWYTAGQPQPTTTNITSEDPDKAWFAVCHTDIGIQGFFFNLMTHWLKVPLEMFLPQTGILTLVLLVSYRLSLDTWRRTMRWKTTSAAAKAASSVENSVASNNGGRSGQQKQTEKVRGDSVIKSNTESSFHLSLKGSPVRCAMALAEAREMANARMVLFLGIIACGAKIPKFILHILLTEDVDEGNIDMWWNPRNGRPNVVNILQSICVLMDIGCVVVKPFLFFSLGSHLREALMLTFCRKGDSVSAPIRTALLHTSHELRNMEIKAVERELECSDLMSAVEVHESKKKPTARGDVLPLVMVTGESHRERALREESTKLMSHL